jgi:23S rRNA (cytosine1962-C5)-methyltransferase
VPAPPPPRWRLAKPLRASIERGHPWIFDRALVRPAPVRAGELALVVDDEGPIATVIADPTGAIAARVVDRPGVAIDAAWAKGRAATAAARRTTDPLLADTDGVRWIHGENDRCPGLVVDGYAGTAVVVFDGVAAAEFWAPHLPAVVDGLRAGGAAIDAVWVRAARGAPPDHPAARAHAIGALPSDVAIREREARFGIDVAKGQKTGFFLDQRLNRYLIGAHAADRTVLNLFSYTGGFSIHAALGGARRVTSVDIAAPAIAAAADNLARSGIDLAAHELVAEDAFAFLARAATAGRRWDLVIADPPSFAPSEKARPAALASYRKLARAALGVVEPGGLFAFASCSSHVGPDDLLAVLAEAGAGRGLRVRQALGAASDHPTLPGFPEGRYLDFFLCDTG